MITRVSVPPLPPLLSMTRVVSECNLHRQGRYNSDLWHAIVIHGKEHWRSWQLHWSATNSNRIPPSLIRWAMLRNCEFSGVRARERKKRREKYWLEKKKPAKFITFSFQRAITMFDADCLITEPPPLHPILREIQFIVSLCRRVGLKTRSGVLDVLRWRDWFYSRRRCIYPSTRLQDCAPVSYNVIERFFLNKFSDILGCDYLIDALASQKDFCTVRRVCFSFCFRG